MNRGRTRIGAALAASIAMSLAARGAAAETPTRNIERAGAFTPFLAEAAARFGLPVSWIAAVLRAESAGDPHAVSRAGALGLMQLMPATWSALRGRLGLGADPFDPRDNILAGAAYLRELYDRYGPDGFLAAYNAGPARYEALLRGERPLPLETRAYLAALAPRLGDAPAQIATADPIAWRRAPVFAGSNASVSQVRGSAPRAAAVAPSSTDPRPDSRRRGDLFVRLSAASMEPAR